MTRRGNHMAADTGAVGRPAGRTAEDTKRRILAAALDCFAEKGFAGTSNKDIAERAGLTAGAVSYHFDSKSDVFLAVHRDNQDDTISRCQAAVRRQTSMAGALAALLDNLGGTRTRAQNILRFNTLARTEAARHPEIAAARDDSRWRALFREVSQLGVSTGAIRPGDELAVRALLATLVAGLSHHAADAPQRNHMEALRALKLLIAGDLIRGSGPGSDASG